MRIKRGRERIVFVILWLIVMGGFFFKVFVCSKEGRIYFFFGIF